MTTSSSNVRVQTHVHDGGVLHPRNAAAAFTNAMRSFGKAPEDISPTAELSTSEFITARLRTETYVIVAGQACPGHSIIVYFLGCNA